MFTGVYFKTYKKKKNYMEKCTKNNLIEKNSEAYKLMILTGNVSICLVGGKVWK